MQYVERAIGSVSRTWNSINPATLSGAIDVLVVEQSNGDYHSSAFHIRFGKISLMRPSQKGVDFYVNDKKIDLKMKLGDGGEAFFVFETTAEQVPEGMLTSPVVSPSASPNASMDMNDDDIDYLDLSSNLGGSPGKPRTESRSSRSSMSSVNSQGSPVKRPNLPDQFDKNAKSSDPFYTEGLGPPLLNEPFSEGNNNNNNSNNNEDVVNDSKKSNSGPESPKLFLNTDGLDEDSRIEEEGLEPRLRDQNPEKIDKIIKRLCEVNIPSTHDDDGSVIMDMTGYKAGGQNTKELEKVVSKLMNSDVESPPGSPISSAGSEPGSPSNGPQDPQVSINVEESNRNQEDGRKFVKTLRLSCDILKSLDLKRGRNEMKFVVRSNGACVTSDIYLWDVFTPVVISDIDGTITKSDAMGHLMTLVGRDWTHAGVGRLYSDIERNGYNILYLTSRSVGLADATRSYLRSIEQSGYKLPEGPVILSPDRTMEALRREVILRKPEIFKMACLRDIAKLYEYDYDKDTTPFYAGFGNRMTDAVSYRSVGVPPTKIFTINSVSEVKMELLELTGIKSSYILITDLVDQLFPPVGPGQNRMLQFNSAGFSDATFWKPPLPELSDDESEDEDPNLLKPANHSLKRRTSAMDWDRNLNATLNDMRGDLDLDSDITDDDDVYGYDDEDEDEDDDLESDVYGDTQNARLDGANPPS